MSKPHAVLRLFRLLHLYIGVFIAPMLLFFALTGALQTFSLHETTQGSSYKPPKWIEVLAQIHKKQTPILAEHHAMPHPAAAAPVTGAGEHASPATKASPASALARAHHPLPLKIFFLLVAVGLFLSTISGLYMTWKYIRHRTVMAVLLIAGVIVPIVLLLV